MPNIRRTFPGDDDDKAKESSDDDVVYSRGGGKQLIRGGKQLGGGKYLRPQEEEESSSEEDQEPPTVQVYNRGGGKQLRPGGGKSLHPPVAADDDEDSDDDELDDDDDELDDDDEDQGQTQTVRVVARGGGKSLSRMTAPQPAEDSEEDEEEEEAPAAVQRVVPRSGGKMLSRMQPPPPEEDSDDDEDDPEPSTQVVKPVQRSSGKALYRSASGGKQLRRAEPEEPAAAQVTTISRSPAGGKQLRRPEPAEEEEPTKVAISRSPAGGKQLRRPESVTISQAPAGGKQLGGKTISRSPAGGKQLRRPQVDDDDADEDDEPIVEAKPKKKAAAKISRSPGGGKQLRRPVREESESEEEESFGDDDEEEDSEEEESDYEEIAKPSSRPRRGAAARKPIVDDEIIGDDEMSSDEEAELDINNTEALIRDDDDRKYLDSLPELEREAILGERFEKAKAEQDMKKAMRQAKQKEQAAKGGAAKAKKPKKSQTDKDVELAKKLSGRRESARDKDAKGAKSKKAAALAALKKEKKIQKQREESDESEIDFADDSDEDSDDDYDEDDEGLKPWQIKAKALKKKASVLDNVQDSDSDDDSAVIKKEKPRRSSTPAAVAGVDDFKKCTIPRRRLARWCSEPFFEAAVLNCFVRVLIGEDDEGVKVYRLCEITDVKVGVKVYKFPITKRGDTPVMTNKMITLRFGKHEKDFPMSLVSDAFPDEMDVKKYVSAMRNIREDVLTKRDANRLARLQHDLVHNYTYTTADIEKSLENRKKQGKTLGNLGAEQTKASIAVQAAKDDVVEAERHLAEAKRAMIEDDDGNHEKAIQEATIALKEAEKALQDRIEEEKRTLDVVGNRKKRLTQRAKDKNWAKVNQRALEANQKADREANKQSGKNASGSERKEGFNPYARRKVKPKILWEVGQDEEKEEDDGKAVDTEKDETPHSDNPTIPTLVQDTDDKMTSVNDSHQFTIDEEGLAQSSGSSLFGKKASTRKRKRTGISLSDYLEKKAKGEL